MPRFYFDVRDGDAFIQDGEGLEFADIEAARQSAATALAEMAKDAIPGAERHDMAIEVRDEANEPLLKAVLTFAVQNLR